MERTAKQWTNFDPSNMRKESGDTYLFALVEARQDILKMAEALRVIGYPKDGTSEDMIDAPEYVQSNFSLEDLET